MSYTKRFPGDTDSNELPNGISIGKDGHMVINGMAASAATIIAMASPQINSELSSIANADVDYFGVWMEQLKQQAYRRNPNDYKEGDKWCDEYFKKTYFDNGFTPEDAWTDYTTMIY